MTQEMDDQPSASEDPRLMIDLKRSPFPFRLPPLSLLVVAFVIGISVLGVVTYLSLANQWIGLAFSANGDGGGLRVVSATGPGKAVPLHTEMVEIRNESAALDLEALDVAVEPDGTMGDYGTYRRFLDRQTQLSTILKSGPVEFRSSAGDVFKIEPDLTGRPLTSLPPDFWVQLTVGFVAWMVSAAVFAFHPRDAGARYLLLSGASTLLFAPAAAIYTTRELAIDGTVFRWVNDLNFLGGSLFAASFVSLLLHYPRRLAPSWVGIGVVGLYVFWFVAQQLGFFESMTFARRILVIVGVVVTFALSGLHWVGTRGDPLARASLQWFLLSWVVGTSLFATFILLPQIFGIDTSQLQGYSFLLFLLVYGGLAFGILRFRLFDLGEWWRRIAVWMICVVLLVVLDLVLLLRLHWSSGLSLGVSLLVCGAAWMPLRSWIWGRLTRGNGPQPIDLFARVMDVALTPVGEESRDLRWQSLLKNLFDPLTIRPIESGPEVVRLRKDGLVLEVPAISVIPPQRLEFAQRGRRLFTPRDVATASELAGMLGHAIESHTSYENGASEERRRIARDMHDNIGAQLLTALHNVDPERKNATIRETISDLRLMINNQAGEAMSLEEAVADLRLETSDRLEAAGIALRWSDTVDGREPIYLPSLSVHTLRSVVRELVSNVIKHSGASLMELSLAVEGVDLVLKAVDNGKGFDPDRSSSGNGLRNIETRVSSLKGKLSWEPLSRGTQLAFRFPMGQAGTIE